jgi:hypothetical protein
VKTTIDLPEEVIRRAKITAIQRKTTLKELIHRSLLREIGEMAEVFAHGHNTDTPVGRFDREQAQRDPAPPSQTLSEDGFPYVIDATTGMAVSRSLNTPGFVPLTADESQAMIERANEEEDLRRAGLLR